MVRSPARCNQGGDRHRRHLRRCGRHAGVRPLGIGMRRGCGSQRQGSSADARARVGGDDTRRLLQGCSLTTWMLLAVRSMSLCHRYVTNAPRRAFSGPCDADATSGKRCCDLGSCVMPPAEFEPATPALAQDPPHGAFMSRRPGCKRAGLSRETRSATHRQLAGLIQVGRPEECQ